RVIQHLRHMHDPAGLFGSAEQEVVMARVIKAAAEAVDATYQAAAQYGETADVVVAAKSVRRPIGLEMWVAAQSARGAKPIHVRVNKVGLVGFVEGLYDFEEGEWSKHVVLAQEGNVFSRCRGDG